MGNRGLYRLLWVVALIAIGALLIMARRPAPQPIGPVTRWTTYEWHATNLSIEYPVGWKSQTSAWSNVSLEMTLSASADNRVIIRRSPLRGAESVMLLRSADTRRRTLEGLHRDHLRSLSERWPDLKASAIETGQLGSNFAAWCDVAYTRPASWGRKAARVLGKTYTIIFGDDQYWLDCFGDQQHWSRVWAPAYAHMIGSLEFVPEE